MNKDELVAIAKAMVAKGKGLTPRVTFVPTIVDCGPVLPRGDGQAAFNEAKFQVGDRNRHGLVCGGVGAPVC